jgi:N-succinyldiaminopimelate aminotransferase
VWVAAGATGALSAAVGAIASPGEEVLILAPFWPLIRGIVQTFRARPVEVPFYDRVDSPEAAVAVVRERLTERTAALYVSTPSNPTGRVLPSDQLEALAAFAQREDLWLLSDEVYEDYVYRGDHVSLGRFAPERTLSVFSFSKAYGMAGNRTGYLVGPPEAVAQVGKVSTHTFYSAPTAGQVAGLRALREGGAWVARARASYRDVGEAVANELGMPPPEGSTFLFLDVRRALDERGLRGFLADCLEDGVALAPGSSCGEDYGDWVRLCYTSAPPTEVKDAARRLAKRIR